MNTKFKWNDKNTKEAVDQYEASNKSIEAVKAIAEALETSHRSVIGKLVNVGNYVKQEKAETKKVEGASKKDLLADLRAKGFNADGFDGATKDALVRLVDLVG